MYMIVHAVLEEESSYIATVAVKDKKTLVSLLPCFLLCAAIKNLLKPSQAKPIQACYYFILLWMRQIKLCAC
jgi:hypothetical protein